MFMVLIKMQKKITKVSKKLHNFVRVFLLIINLTFVILVNSFIEEEIKNGIPAERIVSQESYLLIVFF